MYEYVVVAMPTARDKDREAAYTERVNSVARHGWRLVSMSPGPGGDVYATFERPVSGE